MCVCDVYVCIYMRICKYVNVCVSICRYLSMRLRTYLCGRTHSYTDSCSTGVIFLSQNQFRSCIGSVEMNYNQCSYIAKTCEYNIELLCDLCRPHLGHYRVIFPARSKQNRSARKKRLILISLNIFFNQNDTKA